MKDILFIIGSESDKKSIAPGIELMDEKGMSYDLKVTQHTEISRNSQSFLKKNRIIIKYLLLQQV